MQVYVQDERYVVVTWMAMNDDIQVERYVVVTWMAMNDDVQDERYVVVPWSLLGIYVCVALVHPCTSMGRNDVQGRIIGSVGRSSLRQRIQHEYFFVEPHCACVTYNDYIYPRGLILRYNK